MVLAAIWELAPRLGLTDKAFFPPLSENLIAWWQLLRSGELVNHITASAIRAGAGFALSICYAIPLGLVIGWYKPAAELLNPVLETLRNTAALALLPLFILLLGIGEVSKIAIVVYACSWPILLNTINGVRSVDPLLIMSARSMGVSNLLLFRKIIFPAAIPSIFTGIRLAGATSILVLIAAEMIGAKAGLGYLIIYAQYSFLIPAMYAGIITTAIIGLLINYGLVSLEKRFTYWKPRIGA